jgi:hypothetical protein
MYAETLCFANLKNHKHFVFIEATANYYLWLASITKELAIIKLNPYLTKHTIMTTIHHSEFYADEQAPHTPSFIFLRTLDNFILTPLHLTIILLGRAQLSLKNMCAALNIKIDSLKKLIKYILGETGFSKIKDFI